MEAVFDVINIWRYIISCLFHFLQNFKKNNLVLKIQTRVEKTRKEICKTGWKNDRRHARNKRKTKNTRGLTARTESRQSPFPVLSLPALRRACTRRTFGSLERIKAELFTYGWVSLCLTRTPAMGIVEFSPAISQPRDDTKNKNLLLFSISGSQMPFRQQIFPTSVINCVFVWRAQNVLRSVCDY